MGMMQPIDLFDGRRDALFDSYKVGLDWVEEDVWFIRFDEHFAGYDDIGVYPRRDDGLCRWGCVDIDSGDFSEALEVYGGLLDAGVDAWVEASGSWKDLNKRGYHVWVFADGWVGAQLMRLLLVEVCRHTSLPPSVEINPKQIKATDKGVGNCVRLPYGKRSREHPGYSTMVLSPDGTYEPEGFPLAEFLEQVQQTPIEAIERLGNTALSRQNRRKAVESACEQLRQEEALVPPYAPQGASGGGKNQRAYKILNGLDRAGDGERNNCAFVMACHLKGLNLTLEDARHRMATAVERSFDGGSDFTDEALRVLEGVYRA